MYVTFGLKFTFKTVKLYQNWGTAFWDRQGCGCVVPMLQDPQGEWPIFVGLSLLFALSGLLYEVKCLQHAERSHCSIMMDLRGMCVCVKSCGSGVQLWPQSSLLPFRPHWNQLLSSHWAEKSLCFYFFLFYFVLQKLPGKLLGNNFSGFKYAS